MRRSDNAAIGYQPISAVSTTSSSSSALPQTQIRTALVDEQRPRLQFNQQRMATLVEAGEGHPDIRFRLRRFRREAVVPFVVVGQIRPAGFTTLPAEELIEQVVDKRRR